jgi:hypothetical protein
MGLFRTLIEGIGTLRFVEGGLLTEVPAPNEAPSKVPPMSPRTELEQLEKHAQQRGISPEDLTKIRQIGDCPAQVQGRIKHLHEWLEAH